MMVAPPMQRTMSTVCAERSPVPDGFILYLPPSGSHLSPIEQLFTGSKALPRGSRTPFLSVDTANHSVVNCRIAPIASLISQ